MPPHLAPARLVAGASRRTTDANANLDPVFPRPTKLHWLLREADALLVQQYDLRDRDGDKLHALLKRAKGRRSKKKKTVVTKYFVTQKRGPRCRNQIKILRLALWHTDLGADGDVLSNGFPVGIWDDKKKRISRPYSLEELARGTGLKRPSQRYEGKERSSSAFDRALRDLGPDCAAYVSRQHHRIEQPDGGYESELSDLQLKIEFLEQLGLERERILRAIREARADREAKEAAARRTTPVSAAARNAVSDAMGPMGLAFKDLLHSSRHPPGLKEADVRTYLWFCQGIHAEQPEWPLDQVQAAAMRKLYPGQPP
jgi:hypothetical protein